MANPRRVAVVVGSLRKESFNRKMANALIAMAPQPLAMSIVEIRDLPLFNQDLEADPTPEVAAFKETCGPVHMKAILGTGDLMTLRNVARASWVAMMAGADFIKTSTGKEAVNATLPVSITMVRCIREYAERTGMAVGFKPAGGIRTAKQSLDWLSMMKDELGRPWLEPSLFRIGASGMLADIERQLEHYTTGRYSAAYRHPIA